MWEGMASRIRRLEDKFNKAPELQYSLRLDFANLDTRLRELEKLEAERSHRDERSVIAATRATRSPGHGPPEVPDPVVLQADQQRLRDRLRILERDFEARERKDDQNAMETEKIVRDVVKVQERLDKLETAGESEPLLGIAQKQLLRRRTAQTPNEGAASSSARL